MYSVNGTSRSGLANARSEGAPKCPLPHVERNGRAPESSSDRCCTDGACLECMACICHIHPLGSVRVCGLSVVQVRETSRKPDEMYDLLERLAPGARKLELFGRPHNVHKGWTTLGNQLGKTQRHRAAICSNLSCVDLLEGCCDVARCEIARLSPSSCMYMPRILNPCVLARCAVCKITEPWLRTHLLEEGVFEEGDLTPLPPPPETPMVPPWGGHPPPPRLNPTQREVPAAAESV
eukprot:6190382-Pleurochrysis_carterae.AAC.2